jgi:CheY-like chemotaxis protein
MELKRTVLLIDDDREEYELFCVALESYNKNIACSQAYSCMDAEDIVKGKSFDWIFLDFNLPDLNGFDCLKKLKNNPVTQNIRVYIYSASKIDQSVENLCMAFGAVKWIIKPQDLNGYYKIFDDVFSH